MRICSWSVCRPEKNSRSNKQQEIILPYGFHWEHGSAKTLISGLQHPELWDNTSLLFEAIQFVEFILSPRQLMQHIYKYLTIVKILRKDQTERILNAGMFLVKKTTVDRHKSRLFWEIQFMAGGQSEK